MNYTDTIPLRRSIDWPEYVADFVIPIVYGRVMMRPQPYDHTGNLWIIAAHPVEAVLKVIIDGNETDGYLLQNGTDHIGQPVSVLEIQNPITDRSNLIIEVAGKRHPDTGQRLDRPDLILYDWLTNVCGMNFAPSDFDGIRAWSQANSINAGGVIDTMDTVQTATDKIAQGMGLAWVGDMPGVAMPWPPAPPTEFVADLNQGDISRLSAASAQGDIATRITCGYHRNWATAEDSRAVIVETDTREKYGLAELAVSLPWLQSNAHAQRHAIRLAQWRGGMTWTLTAQTEQQLTIGQHVNINHPYSPLSSAVVTGIKTTDAGSTITLMGGSETVSASVSAQSAGRPFSPDKSPNYIYADGKLTYTVMDENKIPIARANVTLDNKTRRLTDNMGVVQFTTGRGTHTLTISAAGYATQTVTVTL